MKNYSMLFVGLNQWSIQGCCYVYDDSVEKIITPSHLLLARRVSTKLDSDFSENDMDCDPLSRRVHYLQTLIVHYLNRWR